MKNKEIAVLCTFAFLVAGFAFAQESEDQEVVESAEVAEAAEESQESEDVVTTSSPENEINEEDQEEVAVEDEVVPEPLVQDVQEVAPAEAPATELQKDVKKVKRAEKATAIMKNFEFYVFHAQNASKRLSLAANEMGQQGKDVKQARDLIRAGNNSLRNASGELRKTAQRVAQYISQGAYPEDEVDAIRTVLQGVVSNTEQSKESFKKALESLQNLE